MSLYSEIVIETALALPTGGVAVVTGTQMSVRVEEDEMLLILDFQGQVSGVTAELLVMNFEVDGAAASVLPLLSHTFLTGQLADEAKFSLCVKLTKGEHKVALTANAASGGHAIEGTTVRCAFSATRVSSDATLGQGVNSKVQLSL